MFDPETIPTIPEHLRDAIAAMERAAIAVGNGSRGDDHLVEARAALVASVLVAIHFDIRIAYAAGLAAKVPS